MKGERGDENEVKGRQAGKEGRKGDGGGRSRR